MTLSADRTQKNVSSEVRELSLNKFIQNFVFRKILIEAILILAYT